MTATTVNKLLSLLGSIMRHCVKEGHVSSNPIEGLKIQQKKKADEERMAYDRADLQRIVHALPDPSDRPERYCCSVASRKIRLSRSLRPHQRKVMTATC